MNVLHLLIRRGYSPELLDLLQVVVGFQVLEKTKDSISEMVGCGFRLELCKENESIFLCIY